MSRSTNPSAVPATWSPKAAVGAFRVTCPTETFCAGITITGTGVVTSTDGGATWSAPTPVGVDPIPPIDVDCASSSLCAVTDYVGRLRLGVAAPEATVAPGVGGNPVIGGTLGTSAGAWTATPSVTTQWLRCDGNGNGCAPVAGQTGPSYAVTLADAGSTLVAQETAANAGGAATARSAPSGAVPIPPAPPVKPPVVPPLKPVSDATIKAALLKALAISGKPAKLAALAKKGSFTVSFKAPLTGTLVISWYDVPKKGKKATRLATVTLRIRRVATTKVTIKLTRSAKKVLAKAKRFSVNAKGSFTPAGRKAVTAAKKTGLKR